MKFGYAIFGAVLLAVQSVVANNDDLFNYGMDTFDDDEGESFGQPEWDEVSCSDLDECTGFPNKFPYSIGFDIDDDGNQCEWCPEDGDNDRCGIHRQSPINLERNRAVIGDDDEKECPDWHWMQFRDDTCSWDDLKDQFTIQRHSLQINMPQRDNGEIDCFDEEKGRRYPRLDYSKGFPDWWWLQRTEIMVPSQHTQEGHQYAAEVILAHFYQIEHYKNHLGHVSIFLQDYPDAESWAYLDKLICAWRKEEERVRDDCGEDPAPPYGRCELFRDQEPTEEWLIEAGLQTSETEPPTDSPVDSTTAAPTAGPVTAPVPAPPAPVPALAPAAAPTPAPVPVPAAAPTQAPIPAPVPVPAPTSAPTVEASFGADGESDNDGDSDNDHMNPIDWPDTVAPASSPTPAPAAVPVNPPSASAETPPEIDCNSIDIQFDRFCESSKPCCESVRSETNYCWENYDLLTNLGVTAASACYHCCAEPKIVGPPTPELPELPKTIQCSDVNNPFRMCKPNSCCESERSTSNFCEDRYDDWNDNEIEQICYYCCSEPKIINARRNLRSSGSNKEESIPEGARVFYSAGQKYVLGPENMEEEDEDEQEYFDRIYADHKRRDLQASIHPENYEDLEWYPYEWLLKVGTEYYFRYEGTMVVPPCYDTVHWRPMKDPIRVHKRQIDELQRLLAWRLNEDTCNVDTAGVLSDDGNRIKANREIQYYHSTHRKVFCECKNWPSKFEGDKEWCKDWHEDVDYTRFYEHPYSFESNGEWLPDPDP